MYKFFLKIAKIFSSQKDIKEYTVFDAIRDNQGKGLSAEKLVKILKDLD